MHSERGRGAGQRPWRALLVLTTALSTTALGLTFPGAAGVATAQPDERTTPVEAGGRATPEVTAERDDVLPKAMPAKRALRHLDAEEIADSAEQVGRSPRAYRQMVRADDSYWLDRAGATFVVEEAPDTHAAAAVESDPPADEGEHAVDPLTLESLPGAKLTLYIDVAGGLVPQTWRDPGAPTSYPPWDPDGNGATLSDDEAAALTAIWSAVAADYEPFNINVTTKNPGSAALERNGWADDTYGITISLTRSEGLRSAVCGACAGMAYIGTFDAYRLPLHGQRHGWAFTHAFAADDEAELDTPGYLDLVSSTVAHEAGHILGLRHDGTTGNGSTEPTEYYPGHGHWNSIMGGVRADRPLTQWSKGDYPGANEHQDDLAVLAGQLGYRADDAGAKAFDPSSTADTSVDLTGPTTGLVSSAEDVDWYHLGVCSGEVTVAASPTRERSDLDLELSLVDEHGVVVATANPENSAEQGSTGTTVNGQAAELIEDIAPGAYWARVRGGGNGDWDDEGYDAYGSIGSYDLTSTCMVTDSLQEPSSITLTITGDTTSRTLEAVVEQAGAAPAGDVVFRDAGTSLATVELEHGLATLTRTDLTPGVHRFSAEFVPADRDTVAPSWTPEQRVQVLGPTQLTVSDSLTTVCGGRVARLDLGVGPLADGSLTLSMDGHTLLTKPVTSLQSWIEVGPLTTGKHTFNVTYDPPTGTSAHRILPVTVAKTAAALKVKSPKKVRKGKRAKLVAKVTTRGCAASGKMRFKTKGWRKTVALNKLGRAKVKAPKATKGKKQKFVVRYLGNPTTKARKQKVAVKIKR